MVMYIYTIMMCLLSLSFYITVYTITFSIFIHVLPFYMMLILFLPLMHPCSALTARSSRFSSLPLLVQITMTILTCVTMTTQTCVTMTTLTCFALVNVELIHAPHLPTQSLLHTKVNVEPRAPHLCVPFALQSAPLAFHF